MSFGTGDTFYRLLTKAAQAGYSCGKPLLQSRLSPWLSLAVFTATATFTIAVYAQGPNSEPGPLIYKHNQAHLGGTAEGLYSGKVIGEWSELSSFFNEELRKHSILSLTWNNLSRDIAELEFSVIISEKQGLTEKESNLVQLSNIFQEFNLKTVSHDVCKSPFPKQFKIRSVWPESGRTMVQTLYGLHNLYIYDFIPETPWQLVGLHIDYVSFYSMDTTCKAVAISVNQVANVR